MAIYQVTHRSRWLGQEIRNTFYYTTSVGAPSTSEWQDIADEIRSDYVANLQSLLSDDFTFYAIDYRNVGLLGLNGFTVYPTSGDMTGSVGTDNLATQVALLVSNKGSTTKPNKARTYLAGFTEAGLTDSLWVATHTAAAEAFIDYQSNLNAGGTNPLSRVAAQWNSTHTQVVSTNDLSGAVSQASSVPATQRRRRIGVGI